MEKQEITVLKLFMNRVLQEMEARKMNKKDLANEIGITYMHVYNYFEFDFNIFDLNSYD